MFAIALFFALVCVSVDAFQIVGEEGGCCLPVRMEQRQGMVLGKVVNGKSTVTVRGLYVAMDQVTKMIFSSISFDATETMVLQDFPNRVQYIVNGNNCTKAPLEEWTKKCIPAGAVSLGEAYFGHPGSINGLPVNSYIITDTSNVAYVSVTQEERCLPVIEAAHGSSGGVDYTLTLSFFNTTQTISDPHVFDVPTQCKGPDVTTVTHYSPIAKSILF